MLFTIPYVTDWNNDGLPDLVAGMTGPRGTGVYLLRGEKGPKGVQLAGPKTIEPPRSRKSQWASRGRLGWQQIWKRDFSSPANYANSVEPNRTRLRTIIGAVDVLD